MVVGKVRWSITGAQLQEAGHGPDYLCHRLAKMSSQTASLMWLEMVYSLAPMLLAALG